MDLANLLALVTSANVDPSSAPEINVEPEVTETLIGRNLPKVGRGKKLAAVLAAVTAPIHSAPAASSVAPSSKKLNAEEFFLALRNVGKRTFESIDEATGEVTKVVKRDESLVRNDHIQAIVDYTGHDWNTVAANLGTFDQEVRAQAQRELRGGVVAGPTREEQRSAARSMSGYVKGMPAPAQKLLANLVAREKAAVNAMIDAKSPQEKAAHATVLEGIREAMAKLV